MSTYRPIGCDLHSQYELAIIRGGKITLSWEDEQGGKHRAKVIPTDIFSKNHAEFLRVDIEGVLVDVRLDMILSEKSAE